MEILQFLCARQTDKTLNINSVAMGGEKISLLSLVPLWSLNLSILEQEIYQRTITTFKGETLIMTHHLSIFPFYEVAPNKKNVYNKMLRERAHRLVLAKQET